MSYFTMNEKAIINTIGNNYNKVIEIDGKMTDYKNEIDILKKKIIALKRTNKDTRDEIIFCLEILLFGFLYLYFKK